MKKALIILVSIATLYGVFSLAYVATERLTAKDSTVAQKNTQQSQIIPLDANKILSLVNLERAKAGVTPLAMSADLQQSAQIKADDMAVRKYFSHYLPGTTEVSTPEMKVLLAKNCVRSSENISESLDISGDNNVDVINGWINSKPHHEAMLDTRYSLTGLAVSGNKVVQHFCQQ